MIICVHVAQVYRDALKQVADLGRLKSLNPGELSAELSGGPMLSGHYLLSHRENGNFWIVICTHSGEWLIIRCLEPRLANLLILGADS